MLDYLAQFLRWCLERDCSKWYTFSVFDVALMLYSGTNHYLTDGVDSCITLWVSIIGLNAIQTYYYNKER